MRITNLDYVILCFCVMVLMFYAWNPYQNPWNLLGCICSTVAINIIIDGVCRK